MQEIFRRRVVVGYPHISSGKFNLEDVIQVVEYITKAPAWEIDGDEDNQVIGVPRKLFDQMVDMIQAYGLLLEKKEGEK